MRAESSLSRHRQKPWVSMAKLFEVKGLISCADGELTGPGVPRMNRAAGLNGKCQMV